MSQRILFTVEHLYPLGEAQLLFPLAKELVASGHDVVVAVLGQRTRDADLWRESGLRMFFVNGDDRTPLHTYRDGLTVVGELRRLIRLVEPDAVHAWCGEAIWLTLLATQPLPLLESLPEFRLLATELNLHREQKFFRTLVEDKISHRIETLIVPHACVANDLADQGVMARQTRVVQNGVHLEAAAPEKLLALTDRGSVGRRNLRRQVREQMGLDRDAHLAIAVADLVPRTRIKDLVWASDLLACVNDDFHFAVIGVGPQLWRLRRFAAQTEAKDHIHFVGLPSSPEQYLAAADYFWQSHLQEPQPGPLLAAMAMGVPAVSVLGPGIQDIIQHQETGFAVNFGARDEFARWTKFLTEQTEPAKRLAAQGQAHVVQNFAFKPMLNGYLEVYA